MFCDNILEVTDNFLLSTHNVPFLLLFFIHFKPYVSLFLALINYKTLFSSLDYRSIYEHIHKQIMF